MTPPPLRSYQEQAVEWLRNTSRGMLALDLGLGKTATVLSALESRHLPALIVAPPRVAKMTWPTERSIWRPDLSISLATGNPVQRYHALRAGADITVIPTTSAVDAVRTKKSSPLWKTVIFDESSLFKNPTATRTQQAYKLSAEKYGVENCWEMTATPSPNGLIDLYAQFKILDGGERLGQTQELFRNKYFRSGRKLPNGTVLDWILLPGAEEAIYEAIEDIALGMQAKHYLELPEVTYNNVYIDLPGKAQKVYETMRRDLVVDMRDLGLDVHDEYILAQSSGVAHGKLSQIASGFVFDDDHNVHQIHDERWDALRDLLDAQNGRPIIIFYQFIPERERLEHEFGGLHIGDKRFTMDDWNAGKIPVLIAHPASASHGLNLQGPCSTILWFSPTWEAEAYLQGNGRVIRSGQTRPVVIHEFVARGTVNEAAQRRLEGKIAVQNALKDHLESML